MKLNYTLIKILSILILISSIACTRKPMVHTEAELREKMSSEITHSLKHGNFGLFVRKNDIHGIFVYDFTVHKRGQILQLHLIESSNADIAQQQLLTDYLNGYIFNFKMPRKEKMDIRFTLEI